MAAPARAAKARRRGLREAPVATTVWAWEDDPLSAGAVPIERPVPRLPRSRLKLAFDSLQPPPGLHDPGTPQFRWWAAAEALTRAVDFWLPLLPPRATWQRGDQLTVNLDAGDNLNAYYNRETLTFFHAVVAGQTLYTGESPDVLAHECGHAILDIVRPQLWDAMSHEVAALHEAFGDCSAILTALQLPSVCTAVLAETGGPLYRASRLSRVAEQLGWAVRQRKPCAAEPDCLRDAVTCFFYDTPDRLPIIGPAATLTSEPHSYSRVFTGGFFLTLAGMVATLSLQPDPDALAEASVDAGKLLLAAVQSAPIVPAYMAQVAAHLLAADSELFGGRYADAIQNGFMSRGLMSATGASVATAAARIGVMAPAGPRPRRRAATPAADLPTLTLSAHEFGLGDRPLLCQAPAEAQRMAAPAVARDGGPAPSASPEATARGFIRELMVRNRLALPRHHDDGVLRTHAVVEDGDALRVVRRLVDAGVPWTRDRPGR